MATNTMTPSSRANRLHYAWVVLATTTLVLLASGGVRAAIGVFVKPLEAEFGWSRTALSFAVAMSIALYGLTGPVVGRLADRWGPRWILTGGVALVGIGTVAGAGVTQFWQFFVAVGLIAAIGSSATAAPVAATAPPRAMTAAQAAAERTPVSEAVRTWPFLLLCGSFWVCGYSTFGVILAHFIPHATDHGFQPHQAAEALGIMGAMNVVGTIASGWLCDRLGPKVPLALYYLFRGVSLFFLPYVTTVPGLFAFAALFG